MRDYEAEEAIKRELQRRRRAEIRRRRQRRARRRRLIKLGCIAVCLVLALAVGIRLAVGIFGKEKDGTGKEDTAAQAALEKEPEEVSAGSWKNRTDKLFAAAAAARAASEAEPAEAQQSDLPFTGGYTAKETENTAAVDSEAVLSTYALLIDLDESQIVAQRNARDRMNPASMTKILTLLVAAEHITDLDDTFTITREITDYSYSHGCSAAGFDDGETVTVRDLMYGTILPSGADAAAGLAFYVSGSLEGFVELMNEKLEELGLSGTSHFTNCVGIYDENHYSTSYDIAMMLKAAEENELCREVLAARIYTTSATEQHPEGLELSNWFIRRIEDKETGGTVAGAKTGYVAQSGSCGASYFVSDSGKHYICVTADAYSSWRCIYDHVAIYQKYTE